jgi:hypothetical protein
MSKALNNRLAGQVGEFLVCAELGRRGITATPFSGNVPEFDLIATDSNLKSVPIQVKVTRGKTFQSNITKWLNIEIDETREIQIDKGEKTIDNPDLIFVCIFLSDAINNNPDRYFILRKKDVQEICVSLYREWMGKRSWKRPKNYKSLHCTYSIDDLEKYEDKWDIILNILK